MENALDVKWYLIGYGGEEPLIRQRIAEAGMQDRVIILGKKDNPYPYMRACDLYVQPSRYEARPSRCGRRSFSASLWSSQTMPPPPASWRTAWTV